MKSIVILIFGLIVSASVFGFSEQRVKSKELGKYFPNKGDILGRVVVHPNDKFDNPTFYFKAVGESASAYIYEYNNVGKIVKKITIILYRDFKRRNRYNLHYVEIAYTEYDDNGDFLKNRIYRRISDSDLRMYVKQILKLLSK